MTLPTLRSYWRGQILKKKWPHIQKTSFLLPHVGRNEMHDYNVHEALFLNFENQGPWVLGSGPKVRPRWLYGENVFKPSKGR